MKYPCDAKNSTLSRYPWNSYTIHCYVVAYIVVLIFTIHCLAGLLVPRYCFVVSCALASLLKSEIQHTYLDILSRIVFCIHVKTCVVPCWCGTEVLYFLACHVSMQFGIVYLHTYTSILVDWASYNVVSFILRILVSVCAAQNGSP